jgi:thermitase
MTKKKHKCSIFPVTRQEVLTIQDVQQQAGWSITAFDLPDVWKETQGEGVKIAVIDSGCDLHHADLVNNLLPGINLINPNLPPEDDNIVGHATHVCGIICAENNDLGVVGVAPKAKIMPVKVLDKNGNGDLEIVAKGIRWAADNGANFINLSLGSPNPLQQLRKAIQYAATKGTVVFCAAGNSGFTDNIFFPSSYKETISVASIDENFERSKFSCTGKNLDFMAPGGKILSTVPKNWYAILSGTSMSCPFVCGIAALLLSHNNNCNPNEKIPLKNAADYRKVFKQYTTPITNKDLNNKEFYQGFGIIDPRKLKQLFK